jgi:hypothetical protein
MVNHFRDQMPRPIIGFGHSMGTFSPKPNIKTSLSTNGTPIHPDLQNSYRDKSDAFYRPESLITFAQSPHLRPSILYIHGSHSMFSSSLSGRKNLLSSTGTGIGGSGGVAAGMVDEAIVPDGGHLVVMEQPTWMAEEIVGLRIGKDMRRWGETESWELEEWEAWEEHKGSQVDPDWEWWMRERHSPTGPKNTTKENTEKDSKLWEKTGLDYQEVVI